MTSCFSMFCQVNQHELPTEWRDDLNNNPGSKGGDATMGDLPRIPETAAIGHLHLSFEYHKQNLKIRVWQVSDLLLPPPQISMIESIFVRSYLIPDEPKKTNRKTEDVKVETGNKNEVQRKVPLQSGIQHIFTPSSFRFETPLLYAGVTRAIVNERSVRLEVCMTQRHTHRAFLMAIVHMPLSVAVRRPIRERYPLIPCMNYTIPNNMRVYSARDIILEGTGSNPSTKHEPLSRSSSSTCSSVTSHGTGSLASQQKFVSLDLSDSDDEAGEVAGILEIQTTSPIRKPSPQATSPSHSSHKNMAGLNALREVVTGENRRSARNVYIDMGEENLKDLTPRTKKKIIPNELLSVKVDPVDSSSSESLHSHSTDIRNAETSTFVDIGNSQKEEEEERGSKTEDTVVDITRLQGDVVVDLDSSHGTGSSDTGESSGVTEGQSSLTASTRKKILPPSELLSQTAQKLTSETRKSESGGAGEDLSQESSCVYDDISRDKSGKVSETGDVKVGGEGTDQSSDGGVGDKDKPETAGESSDSYNKLSVYQRRLGNSRSSIRSETSRPETPVWDFYDFADDEGGEGQAGESGSGGGDGSTAAVGDSVGDAASKALGTLQESILRLSRSTRLGAAAASSNVLETELVSGPVLPTVMMEEFEEMEDGPVVEEEEEEDGPLVEEEEKTLKENGSVAAAGDVKENGES